MAAHSMSSQVQHCCFTLIESPPGQHELEFAEDSQKPSSSNSHESSSRCARACNLLFALAYDHELDGHSKVVEAFRSGASLRSETLFAPIVKCVASKEHTVRNKCAAMKLVNALVTPADGEGQFALKQRMDMRYESAAHGHAISCYLVAHASLFSLMSTFIYLIQTEPAATSSLRCTILFCATVVLLRHVCELACAAAHISRLRNLMRFWTR